MTLLAMLLVLTSSCGFAFQVSMQATGLRGDS